jgi:hypothetical protein
MSGANTTTTGAASENDETCATPGTAQATKRGGYKAGRAGAAGKLFRAVAKAVTRRDDDEPPQPRRRSGKTDKGFVVVWRTALHRAAMMKTDATARGRYAALQPTKASPAAAADPFAAATAYLSNTLDWLNLWQANRMDSGAVFDDNFDTHQDHHFPQP